MFKKFVTGAAAIVVAGVLAGCGAVANATARAGGEAPAPDHPLIGSWEWEFGAELWWEFEADGTGSRADAVGGELSGYETFRWTVTGDGDLYLDRGLDLTDRYLRVEEWTYRFDGDIVTLSSRQEDDLVLALVPVGPGAAGVADAEPDTDTEAAVAEAADADADAATDAAEAADDPQAAAEAVAADALHGTWAWDGLPAWQYTFSADGTGTRPSHTGTALITFDWTVAESGELRISGDEVGMIERWEWTVADGALTLRSLQVAGMEYTYIAVDTTL